MAKKVFLSFFICCFVLTNSLAQQYKFGLIFNDNSYTNLQKKPKLLKKGNLPSAVSYEAYAPSIGSQGALGTCVGFASGYYFRTMLDAIQKQISQKASIDKLIYSPSFLYNNIAAAPEKTTCDGALIEDALKFLHDKGCVSIKQFAYPNCGVNTNLTPQATSKISSYSTIFDIEESETEKVRKAKEALSEGYPIIIGLMMTNSFRNINQVWDPSYSEANLGGHALCVIGYDDNKFGGAFRIINSWGEEWGDNGLCWVKYKDFGHYTKYAFQGFPIANPSPPTNEVTLSGTVKLQLLDKSPVNVFPKPIAKGGDVSNDDDVPDQMIAYNLKEAQYSGTRFKFLVSINKQGYVYALGSDLSNRTSKFFPVSDKINPAFGANTEIMLPAEDKSVKLDNVVGTDYWLFLFSEKPIDIDSYKQKIDNAQGPFAQRVMTAFGNELTDPKNIGYFKDGIGFELKGNPKGSIVPLMLSLEHK